MSSSKTEAQRDLGEPISEYNRLTGIALLLAIGAVFLLVNFFCAPITTLGPPSFRDGVLLAIYMVMGGVIMAEPVVLLIWLLLGGGSAVGRWGFVTVGLLVLIACLFLGFSFFCLEVDRPLGRQLAWVFRSPLMFAPICIWSLSLPLILCRTVWGWQLKRQSGQREQTSGTTRGLLIFTGFSALAFGAVQLLVSSLSPYMPSPSESRLQMWLVAGCLAAFGIAVSLLFVVAALACLLRERGFWMWLWIWPLLTISITAGGLLLVSSMGFAESITRDFPNWIGILILWPASYSLALVVFMSGMRLLGYRLSQGSQQDH